MSLVEMTHRLPLAEGAQLMPEDFARLRVHYFDLCHGNESRRLGVVAGLAPKAGYIGILVNSTGMAWTDAAEAVGQVSPAEMQNDLQHYHDIGHLAAAGEALYRMLPEHRTRNTEKIILWRLGQAGHPALVREGWRWRGLRPLLTSGSLGDKWRGALKVTCFVNPERGLLGVREELLNMICDAIRQRQRAVMPVAAGPYPLRKTPGPLGRVIRWMLD